MFFILWGIWDATWKQTKDLSRWALHPGHCLLSDPVKISLTERSWKLKLLGHVWKPGQVEWCHFTTNRHIHAADKGSLNFTVCWGHQPFWTVTFNRIKRGKMHGLFQISWRFYKKSSCSSQILFVFRVKGLCTVCLVLSRRAGGLYSLSTSVINIWSVTFWFWGISPIGILKKYFDCKQSAAKHFWKQ